MKGPWWSEGIAFECQPDCGKCCDEPGGIVYLSTSDAQRLAQHHGLDFKEWLFRDCTTTLDGRFILNSRPEDEICIYLDQEKRCSVYDARPNQCRAFPWWQENLRSDRTWKETCELCPGLTVESPVISGDEITFHVQQDRISTRGFRRIPNKE